MRLYSAMGARGLAIRQFQVCRSLLRDELNVAPDRETTSLYEDLVADDVPARTASFEQYGLTTGVDGARPSGSTSTASFASRV
jgi:DNA-binding SARP family transcriptional activator